MGRMGWEQRSMDSKFLRWGKRSEDAFDSTETERMIGDRGQASSGPPFTNTLGSSLAWGEKL